MKKFTYLVVIIFATLSSFAQQLDLNPKTRSVEGPSDNIGSLYDRPATSGLTNNSPNIGDSMIVWKIIEMNMPSGWTFDFCDPMLCMGNLKLDSSGKFKLAKGATEPVKGLFKSNGFVAGNAIVKILFTIDNSTASVDTLTLLARGWATGLSKVKKSTDVSFYPNPAKDNITVKYNTTKPIEGNIYNVLGSKVKSFQLMGAETAINISDLQGGVYFIRFVDGGNMVAKSFTKSH